MDNMMNMKERLQILMVLWLQSCPWIDVFVMRARVAVFMMREDRWCSNIDKLSIDVYTIN